MSIYAVPLRKNKMRRLSLWPFLFLAAILTAVSAWRDATVYNENGRLASGAAYWRTGDYSLFRVNPPLTAMVGALPSILAGAETATRAELGITRSGREEYQAGSLFVKKNSNYRSLLFAGRLCCIVLLLSGLACVFRYARELGGTAAAAFCIGLTFFSPWILGHGHLIAPDAVSGVFAVAAVYFFRRWLRDPVGRNAFAAGLALGLAELTKFTLLIFYPLFPILWLICRPPKSASAVSRRRQLAELILIFAVSLLVINMGYFFEGTGRPLRNYRFQTTLFSGYPTLKEIPFDGGNRFDGSGNVVETALGYLPMPFPQNFIQGIDTQRIDFESGIPSYLRGRWSDRGWWYYYLYAVLLKTPLGTIGLFLLAIFCTLFLKGYNADWRDEVLLLLPGIALLAFVSSQTGFSIHSRYAIPALPFFFLWSTKAARAFAPEVKAASPKSSCAVRRLAVFLLIWSVASSLWVYPHSIAYFNELAAVLPTPEDRNYPRPEPEPARTVWQKTRAFLDAGPLNGPRHLLDSNIDWGQDYYALKRWREKHPETNGTIVVDGFYVPAEPDFITPSKPTKTDKTTPMWYALSVNRLYGQEKEYRRLLNFTPEAVIGYTTYIYHVSREDLDRAESPETEKETNR